ncbi:helix-turn-helix transcriptional regulator [Streptomyces sp. Ru71]|uniref:helix-turn-helix transcriptional regulator n=1 Tax=Streptomyces sp. Ru71 TaxID=2080746 RepID=UPI000CDE14CD|nr:LuxR family transcriptional regulator [Streptomyces sp. Ru71]POX56699.1 helix-turn-helix transcriptional regulator [Streptomyces sp. Ru71]
MTASGHDHEAAELCEPGLALYARALREGHVTTRAAEPLPCLVEAGLLQPDATDAGRLRPLPAALALPRLLRTMEDDIARRRRREALLVEAFEPLLALPAPHADGAHADTADTGAIRLLSGIDRINRAITEALSTARAELLTIQPHASHVTTALPRHAEALSRDQDFLDRGGRIRALYQHTTRHMPTVIARYERLRGDVQARTLDEVTKRLLILDREVAYIPANADRTLALEARHPALVDFLATAFDRLWRLATPMFPEAVQPPTRGGVTPRQRAIAALLIEGHTDAVIAERLGMNVRTVREHIAKLAATLGSESRAQLGYLISRSGILDAEA